MGETKGTKFINWYHPPPPPQLRFEIRSLSLRFSNIFQLVFNQALVMSPKIKNPQQTKKKIHQTKK